VVQLAEDALRRTCAQVAQLEALREALGEQLAAMDEPRAAPQHESTRRKVMSAA
jgi:hypothetical protein